MVKQLVRPNDPVLIKVSEEIPVEEIKSAKTKKIIEEILDASYGRRENREKPTVVGLAAPQIGISKRIIAVDIGADKKGGLSELKIYVNPEIISRSKDMEEWCEGCWSTGRVAGAVLRNKQIKVKSYTVDGEKTEEKFEGYVARIFQHEIDHLNGNEFVNRITDSDKLHWVEEDEWVKYKKEEGWRDWPRKCSKEKWEKIKGIKA